MPAPQPQYRIIFTSMGQNPALVEAVQRFRKALFIDVLNWDLAATGEFERDEFDTAETVHGALHLGNDLIGGFRAIRCDQPYLGRCVFPELASDRPYPQTASSWEISRFGVLPHVDRRHRLMAARVNYAAMFRFAQLRQAESLVAIADLTYERFLSSLGIETERFGSPQLCAADASGNSFLLVAGQIPIPRLSGPRFRDLLSCLSSVELIDETRFLRPSAVSA